MTPADRPRGRFAPSPTGPLHLGSLVAALGSWMYARRDGGEWLLRIEDIDPPREVVGAADQQRQALAALGLVPDGEVVWQSRRGALYQRALDQLLEAGHAFECRCSRADVAASGGVHRRCVPGRGSGPAAVRLRVGHECVTVRDQLYGEFSQDLARDVGDFVLRRADGPWAYQLAVVVDDAAQGITEVVRGADLLDSTPRQVYLQQKLGLPTPRYAHLPLVLAADGSKLGKSTGADALPMHAPWPALAAAWAALGQQPEALVAQGQPAQALERARLHFDPARIPPPRWPGADGSGTRA